MSDDLHSSGRHPRWRFTTARLAVMIGAGAYFLAAAIEVTPKSTALRTLTPTATDVSSASPATEEKEQARSYAPYMKILEEQKGILVTNMADRDYHVEVHFFAGDEMYMGMYLDSGGAWRSASLVQVRPNEERFFYYKGNYTDYEVIVFDSVDEISSERTPGSESVPSAVGHGGNRIYSLRKDGVHDLTSRPTPGRRAGVLIPSAVGLLSAFVLFTAWVTAPRR